jgi:hypothetical protein
MLECFSLALRNFWKDEENNSLLNYFLNTLRMNLVRLSRPYTCFAYSLRILPKHDADAEIQVSPNDNMNTLVYHHTLSSHPNGKLPSNLHPLAATDDYKIFYAKPEENFQWRSLIFIFRLIYCTCSRFSITHCCFRALANWIQITTYNVPTSSIPIQTISQNNPWPFQSFYDVQTICLRTAFSTAVPVSRMPRPMV